MSGEIKELKGIIKELETVKPTLSKLNKEQLILYCSTLLDESKDSEQLTSLDRETLILCCSTLLDGLIGRLKKQQIN